MSIEFPLLQKQTPFGPVSGPKIPLAVRTVAGYRTYRFLIDTGADFSVAPRRLAEEIGLEWADLPQTQVMGIEQGAVSARLGSLPIVLAGIELTVRCLFVDAPKSAFLLGRADVLDRFILTIDQLNQRIVITDVR